MRLPHYMCNPSRDASLGGLAEILRRYGAPLESPPLFRRAKSPSPEIRQTFLVQNLPPPVSAASPPIWEETRGSFCAEKSELRSFPGGDRHLPRSRETISAETQSPHDILIGNGVVDLGNVVWEARPLSVDDEVDAEEVVLELGFDLAVERLGRGDLGFFGVDLWGLRARTFFEESSQSFVLVLSCLLCSRRCLLCSLQGLNTVEGGVEGLLHEGGLSACGCRHLEEVERLENEVEGRKDEVEGREDEVEVLEVEVERVIDEVEEVAKVGGVKSKRSKKLRSKGCLTSYGELLSIPRSIFKSPRTRAVRDGTVAQVVPVAIDKEGT